MPAARSCSAAPAATIRRLGLGTALAVLAASAPLLALPAAQAVAPPAQATAVSAAAVAAADAAAITRPRPSQRPEVPGADGELVSRRTETSRTYRQSDGSFRTVVGTSAQNFRDDTGALAPIDTTLVRVPAGGGAGTAPGAAFRTRAGAAVLSVPGAADGAVRVSGRGGAWVQTQLLGATGVPAARGSSAVTAGALPGVDTTWTSTVGGLKETFTLSSAAATSTFRFALSASAGLTPRFAGNEVQLVDGAGTQVAALPAPFMDDAAGAHSDAVSYSLAPAASAAGVWDLTVTADRSWLAAPGRAFPVVLDPTILFSASGSGASQDLACEIRSSTPTTSSCAAASFAVGAASGSVSRAVVRFPQLNQVVPADAIVAEATLEMPVAADSGSGALTLEGRPLTAPFTNATTWNTRNGSTAWTGGAGAAGQTTAAADTDIVPTPALGTLSELRISALAQRWLNGQTPNYGLLVKMTDETVLRRLTYDALTSTCTATSCGTRLTVSGLERLGKYQGAKFYDTQLTDSSAVSINVSTGNALVTAKDLGVDRTYNSKRLERVGQIGRGWNFGAGRDTFAAVQVDKGIRYYAPGEGLYMFRRNTDGSYASPPGFAATATTTTLANGGDQITIKFGRSGTTMTFSPPQGQLSSSGDRNGNTTTYSYVSGPGTGDNRPITSTITDPAGRAVTAANNGQFLTGLTDAGSRTTGYGYGVGSVGGSSDRLLSVTDADGGTTAYDYDADARLTRITTPAGRVVRLAYDSSNRVISLTRVTDLATDSGPTTLFDYTPITASPTATNPMTTAARGNTVITDPLAHATTYTYDTLGQVTRVADPLGRHRDTEYGPDGNVTAAYDAMGTATSNGKPTTYTYDTAFNPTSATAPTGASSSATYTNPAQKYLPDTSTDTQGNKTAYSYDGPGNLTRTQDTTGGATGGVSTSRGVYGNTGVAACGGRTGQTGQVCTETDGNGNTTRNTYDGAGNLTAVTPPANTGTQLATTTFTYDALGRVASKTDGKGTTRYSYDGAGRITQVRLSGVTTCTPTDITAGNCLTYTYDRDGNTLTRTDSSGTSTYTYDQAGREKTRTLPGQAQQSLSYDAAGNLLTVVDAYGTSTYGYDTANQLISLAEPGGTCGTAPDRCTTFAYNGNGARTTTTYPTNPVTTMTSTPDDSGRVINIKAVSGSTPQSDLSYTYAYRPAGATADKDGALTTSRTDNLATGTAGRTTTYGYDTLQRLTNALEKNSAGSTTANWAYGYDAAGNRTSAALSPQGTPGSATTTFGYNAANQLASKAGSTTDWTYDSNGNQTASAGAVTLTAGSYNNKNQLTSTTPAGSTARASTYSGLDQNEAVNLAGTVVRNSALGVSNLTSSSGGRQVVRDPDGTLVAIRTGTATAGTSNYYVFDGLGSVVALISPTGTKTSSYTYDPYGQTRTETGTAYNPYRYTGGYYDTTSKQYKLGVRYYDPAQGRFTQTDPTEQDPHYTYAGNNPSSNVDPGGASFFGCAAGLFGGVSAGLATVGGVALVLAPEPTGLTKVGGVAAVGSGLTGIAAAGLVVADQC